MLTHRQQRGFGDMRVSHMVWIGTRFCTARCLEQRMRKSCRGRRRGAGSACVGDGPRGAGSQVDRCGHGKGPSSQSHCHCLPSQPHARPSATSWRRDLHVQAGPRRVLQAGARPPSSCLLLPACVSATGTLTGQQCPSPESDLHVRLTRAALTGGRRQAAGGRRQVHVHFPAP